MTAPPHPAPRHPVPQHHGLAALAAGVDLLLCDVWGVLHNGVRHFPAAADALLRFRRNGGTVVLVTNAPAPAAQVRARLDRLGVPRACYDGIAAAGDVAADLVAAAGCPPVFVIGPERETAILGEAARRGPRVPALAGPGEAALAVCTGLDATGDCPEDYDGLLAALRARDLPLVCANPDLVVEVGDGLVFCAGAIAARYAAAGGTVLHAGKPHPAIYERAFATASAVRGVAVARDRILAIGDAAATDLAGAARAGVAALFITAGIHRARLHPAADGLDRAALAALLDEHATTAAATLPRLSWHG